MKTGYRRTRAAIATVGAILLLVVGASACSSGDDENVDLYLNGCRGAPPRLVLGLQAHLRSRPHYSYPLGPQPHS